MILNLDTVTPEIRQRAIDEAKDEFDLENNLDTIQATEETRIKLKLLNPNTLLYDVADNGDMTGWVVNIPTTIELMNKFVGGEITEKGLLDMCEPAESYQALYLCATVTLPKYRRQGVATRLTKEALLRLPLDKNFEMYAWPLTEEGKGAIKKLELETGKIVHIRK